MYKLLIVDDERIVRLGLRNIIEWEDMGVELVGEAKDGREALDLIDEYGVQLLVTDLKMPNMDGIELIKVLKEKDFDGKILVLSNYDDFALVKEAMKLGVFDYMLKITMDVKEFATVLENMVTSLDEEKKQKAENVDVMIQARRGERLFREKALRALLLEKPLNEQWVSDKILEHELQISKGSNQVVYLQLDALEGALESQKIKDVQLLSFSIKNILSDILHGRTEGEIIDISDKEFVVIVPEEHHIEDLGALAKRISYLLNMYINISVSTLLTESKRKDLYSVIQNCRKYILCKFYEGPGLLHQLNEKKMIYDMEVYYEELMALIKASMYKKDYKAIKNCFLEILAKGKERYTYPAIIKNTSLMLMNYILNMSKESLGSNYENIDDKLNNVEFMEDFSKRLTTILDTIENSINLDSAGGDVISQIEGYINLHIHKKITLKQVAEYVHLNASYLSRLFKQSKGVSFIDYCNRLKIDKAKEIMTYENLSVQEVGQRIGINDPYYFNKVFKKYAGVSPSNYKVSLNELQE